MLTEIKVIELKLAKLQIVFMFIVDIVASYDPFEESVGYSVGAIGFAY